MKKPTQQIDRPQITGETISKWIDVQSKQLDVQMASVNEDAATRSANERVGALAIEKKADVLKDNNRHKERITIGFFWFATVALAFVLIAVVVLAYLGHGALIENVLKFCGTFLAGALTGGATGWGVAKRKASEAED